jgi:hypothetical protein
VDKIIQEFETAKWPMNVRYKTHIAILAAVTLALGIYLASTMVLIAKDGIIYIEYAKSIADNAIEVIRNYKQPPGYPFLIYLMHKAMGLFYNGESLQGWIISAQIVSLFGKVIASIALYFVGSYFVGPRLSFWGILILSILPDSADYGSDALSDWPHVMFLATGFLLLLLGAQYRKNWIFGWAGIVAGLGYLVRSEGCQLVLYGSAWLLLNLIRPQGKMRRAKAAGSLILLLAGFAIIAIPYMWFKGYIFPKQLMWKLPALFSMSDNNIGSAFNTNMCLAGLSISKIIGDETLITNMCEILMYYFIPALLIGSYYYFQRQTKRLEQTFFAAAFIIINVAIAIWQPSYLGYLSRRHTLPLVAFTIFYIPVGFHIIACRLSKITSKGSLATEENIRRWFFILMVVGFGICVAKLVMISPLRWEKQNYREAAAWLSKNTAPMDTIAVTDPRISFYAGRYITVIKNERDYAADVKYAVHIAKKWSDSKEKVPLGMSEIWSSTNKEGIKILIYERK